MNVHRLAGWLNKRGWKNILYGSPGSPLYEACRGGGIETRPLNSKSKIGDFFLSQKLAKQIKNDRARVVLFHQNKNLPLAVLAKLASGRYFKLLYMQHMHVGGKRKDFFHNWEYRQLDAWLTPLPMFVPRIAEKVNLPQERVKIVPLGIELDRFANNLPDRATARKRLDLPKEAMIIGVVGRIDPKKCQHVLIEAATQLHREGQQIHLLIIGDKSRNEETGYYERLLERVGQLGLRDFVHFRPHMPEIEYGFAAMDIFAMTSKSETYGMVTIEAMASRLPVVGTNAGGTADIIDHGANGLLVEPLDSDELADAIRMILDSPELAAKLSQQAHKDALVKYSHHHQCNLLEAIIDDFRLNT